VGGAKEFAGQRVMAFERGVVIRQFPLLEDFRLGEGDTLQHLQEASRNSFMQNSI
jgi:hypothetical protein